MILLIKRGGENYSQSHSNFMRNTQEASENGEEYS